MGKSSRIQTTKANQKAKALGSYKQKSGMPNWAINLITIVITAAILLGALALTLSANGTLMRMRTAMETEHFRVNGKMMTYFVNAKYQNFLSTYSSVISSLSLDTTKPLDKQVVGDKTANPNNLDAALCGEFQGTWLEYFISETEAELKTKLLYCEIAHNLGVKLEESDYADIDEAIHSLEHAANDYGYPLNAYIAASFGQGVKEKDIRKAMEIESLYYKASTELSEKLLGEIGDDRVTAAYDKDPSLYNLIDYSFYSFRVDYADISEEMKEANANVTDAQILQEYQTRISEAKDKAEQLYAQATIEEFETFLFKELAAEAYDEELEDPKLPTEGKPEAAQFDTIRKEIVSQAVKEVLSKTEAAKAFKLEDEKYVGYGIEVTKEYADLFNKIKDEVYDMVETNVDGYVKDKISYIDNDAFSTWAFDAARKADGSADGKHKILNGDGSDEAVALKDIKNEKGYFRIDVYRMRKTQYKNTEKTPNLACMTFATKEEAQAAIDALKAAGTIDQATFDRIASEKSAMSSDVVENYVEGAMQSSAFDAWAFADGRKLGDYTDAPVALSTSSGSSTYAVIYYVSEGAESWFVNVKDALLNEDFKAYVANAESTIVIEVKANVLKKIKIGA